MFSDAKLESFMLRRLEMIGGDFNARMSVRHMLGIMRVDYYDTGTLHASLRMLGIQFSCILIMK